jgi:hypothetical protein
MQTTQLFVELVVIGMGTLLWLGLLLAAIFGYNPQSGLPDLNTGVLALFTGFGYALGIVVDRISRNIFEYLFKRRKSHTELHAAAALETMENVVLTSDEALARQMQYNRSRFRICRSWALNLFLVSGAFALWNIRVAAVPFWKCLAVISMGCALSCATLWIAWLLRRDYEINLQKSFNFIMSKRSRGEFE